MSSLISPVVLTCLEKGELSRSNLDTQELEVRGLRSPKLTIQDAEALEKSLHKIFGFGAKVIEKQILSILYAKLQLQGREFEQDFNFAEEVEKASELYKSKLSACEML